MNEENNLTQKQKEEVEDIFSEIDSADKPSLPTVEAAIAKSDNQEQPGEENVQTTNEKTRTKRFNFTQKRLMIIGGGIAVAVILLLIGGGVFLILKQSKVKREAELIKENVTPTNINPLNLNTVVAVNVNNSSDGETVVESEENVVEFIDSDHDGFVPVLAKNLSGMV